MSILSCFFYRFVLHVIVSVVLSLQMLHVSFLLFFSIFLVKSLQTHTEVNMREVRGRRGGEGQGCVHTI